MTLSVDIIFILVVEDDMRLSEGIADLLRLEGYLVETAPNGEAALAKMRVFTPDLVLSNVMMPRMNGHQLCAQVRANPAWHKMPFIFLTTLGRSADQNRGIELGADDYMIKPFEPDDLLVTVRNWLQRSTGQQSITQVRHRLN